MTDASTTLDVPVAFTTATVAADGDGLRIGLPTDATRGAAHATTRLHRPALVRDALLALGDVLASDLRYRGRDRADYLAYLLAKGKGVSKQVWDAQKEFLQLRYAEAARTEEPLDPVLTVGADALRFELLSRDESAYAQLAIATTALASPDLAPGTTLVDLGPAALRAIGRMRTYRPTTLSLTPGVDATPATRRVPLRWLRALGQIQAAALLPAERFTLAPIDLYNVLQALRMRKAKQAPRALRYELVPGQAPRIVLEPWDLVLTATGGPYTGTRPMVVRTWGRARLQVLARLLPHAQRVEVHLLGPGLPAFYVVDAGDATLTLGLSGWTDAGWAGIATFDQLAVGADAHDDTQESALAPRLAAGLPLAELTPATRAALTAEAAGLRAAIDLARGVAFARPLLAAPPPTDALRYRDAREAAAHRLLADAAQVTLTKVHELGAEGERIEGQVDDARAHRRFLAGFTIDREGRTASATCTCPAFRRAGIKEGPCEHMIALRVLHGREQARKAAARATDDGRRLIRAETRTLFRRTARGSETFRLSLDDRSVIARWGAAEPLRMTRQLYPSADLARADYFARLDELAGKGFIDATA